MELIVICQYHDGTLPAAAFAGSDPCQYKVITVGKLRWAALATGKASDGPIAKE